MQSYSTVDFARDSEEEIDSIKYNCALKMNAFNREQATVLEDLFTKFKDQKISEDNLLRRLLDMRFRNINFFQRHQGFLLSNKKDSLGDSITNVFGNAQVNIIASNINIRDEIELAGDYSKFITTSNKGDYILRFISKTEQEIYKLFGEWIPEYESSKQTEVRESFASLVNDNMYVLTQMVLGVYRILLQL